MKAMILHNVGEYPVMEDMATPNLKEGQVLVNLKAAALNHRDLYITQGLYPNIKTPSILGSDGVGLFNNKRVILNPSINWGADERVQSADYEVLGMPTNGTFATHIAIDEEALFDCPEHLSDEEAAGLPLGGLTAYRALFTRGQAQQGETVVITGAGGGVATFAIQFAVAQGCKVFVTSRKDEKIKFAQSLGAQGGVNYTKEGWHKELKSLTNGIDVVIDSAGGQGFELLSKIMNPGGRMAFYGGTVGKIPNLNPQILFWRQITILGSTMGSSLEFKQMLAFVEKHKIKTVVDKVYDLEHLHHALDRMKEGQQLGKIVVTF